MVNTFIVSFRNLTRNKIRSFLATIGIILGTLAITALLSLGLGLQQSIESQFESAGGELLQITPKSVSFGPPGQNAVGTLTEDDVETVERLQGVGAVAGRLIESATITAGDTDRQATISSFPEEVEQRQLILRQLDISVDEGRFIQPGERNSVVIGSSYREGDADLRLRDDLMINNASFDIVGVLAETNQFIIDQTIIMGEERFRTVFDRGETYDLIIVEPSENVADVQQRISRELRRERGAEAGEETFEVQTNQEALQSITSILQILSGVLAAIGSISLVLGGITIMNTMYTTVLERTREIGVMKSVGASRRDITSLFVTEAGLLGGLGGLAGSGLGLGLAYAVAYLARSALDVPFFQASLSPWLFLAGLLFATITGVISGYAPARRAAKKHPVEALRG